MPDIDAVEGKHPGDAERVAAPGARNGEQQLRRIGVDHRGVFTQQHPAVFVAAHYCRRRVPEFSRCMLKLKAATVNRPIMPKASGRLTSDTPSTP